MWTFLRERLAVWSDNYLSILTMHPAMAALVLAGSAALAVWFLVELLRHRPQRAFWCVAGLIVLYQTVSHGEDAGHHTYRITLLADQVRQGSLSLLLLDPATGSLLPTFVYYGFLPYLPSLLLALVGVPAFVSLKIVAALALVVMAAGMQALIEALPNDGPDRHERRSASYLAAILFVTANYVFGLWTVRAGLAEIWVYCLVPWVVLAVLNGRPLALFALLFVQICCHPIVFAQSFAGELLAVLAFTTASPVALARRCLLPIAAAIVCAAPFWAPQFLWKDYVLATAGLPVTFDQTFFAIADLARPRHLRTLGIWLPIAVASMVVLRGGRLPARLWWFVLAFVAILAIQTQPLFPLASKLPVLPYSLFIWRLMLPAAFIGFAVLVVGWPSGRRLASGILAGFAVLAVASMSATFFAHLPDSFARWSSGVASDSSIKQNYTQDSGGWGVLEFAPKYTALPSACGIPAADLQRVDVAALRTGVRADTTYLSVHWAPIGTVGYEAGGSAPALQACEDRLVLGPLAKGSIVRLSTTKLDGLLLVRAGTLAAVAVFLLFATFRRRRPVAG